MDYNRYIARMLPLVVSLYDREEGVEACLPDLSEQDAIAQTLNEIMSDGRFLTQIGPRWERVLQAGRLLGEFAEAMPEEFAACSDRETYARLRSRIRPACDAFFRTFGRRLREGSLGGGEGAAEGWLPDGCGTALRGLLAGEDEEDEAQRQVLRSAEEPEAEAEARFFQHRLERFLAAVPSSIRRLAELVGRDDRGKAAGRAEFLPAAPCDIIGVESSDNLNALLPVELALLGGADTESIFYRRYLRRELQTFSVRPIALPVDAARDRQGPIVVCLDTSGSMAGESELIAKTLTLAVATLAQKKGRSVYVISFSNAIRTLELTDIRHRRLAVEQFLQHSFSGGSDLSEALEFLASDLLGREAYARADVLTISDFELEPLSAAAREAIGRAKRTSGTRFFGLLTGAYEGGMYFCDHRWRYMRGRLAPIR